MTDIYVRAIEDRILVKIGAGFEHGICPGDAALLADALLKAIPDHAKLRLAALDESEAKARASLETIAAERAKLASLIAAPAEPADAISPSVRPTASAEPSAPAVEPLSGPKRILAAKYVKAADQDHTWIADAIGCTVDQVDEVARTMP